MIDKNRVFGANKTLIGEFRFSGTLDAKILPTRPAQYEISLAQPVEGIEKIQMTALDLGFKPPEDEKAASRAESEFMKQFSGLLLSGRLKVTECDDMPYSKEDRVRCGELVAVENKTPLPPADTVRRR